MPTTFNSLVRSENYKNSKRQLLLSLRESFREIQAPRPGLSDLKESYDETVRKIGELRGRDLFFPCVASGAGNGPFLELADGSVKYDLITGIGVHFFGHSPTEMFEAIFDSLWGDIMQGNLSPGMEYKELLEELLGSVGTASRLRHGWLTTCGSSANEIALKIVRQKKSPATRIFAFKDCFAGRTTALQELTDNPKYREGQPVYGEITYLKPFDSASKKTPQEQAQAVVRYMSEEMDRYPQAYAALEFELVQGEGGFRELPREFILPILKEAKARGLFIWDDEVQTFGRTGELFCYQKYGLEEWIDVVTVGKILQSGAVLFTSELKPRPGLVSGTFASASSSLAAGRWVVRRLKDEFVGPQGRISALQKLTQNEFELLKQKPVGKHIVDTTVIGGMVAFTIFDGSLELSKKFLNHLFDLGAVAFYCGHGPHRIRMLPPWGAVTDEQWRNVFQLIEKALEKTAASL